MKKLLLILMLFPVFATAQSDNDLCYTAKCGKEYCEGDTIIMGKGSGVNGHFLWLQMGGWAAIAFYNSNGGPDQNNIGRAITGQSVIIKRIKSIKHRGVTNIVFVVGGSNISNYNLLIEEAIEAGEVKLPAKYRPKKEVVRAEISIADELAKLNQLRKDSVLTEEEYQAQKKKLLEN